MEGSGKFEMKSIQRLIDECTLAIKPVGSTVGSSEYKIYEPYTVLKNIRYWCLGN